MEMRLSMKIGKRIFFSPPRAVVHFFKIRACAGKNLCLRPGRNLESDELCPCARGASTLLRNFAFAPEAEGCLK